jgi:hypothetical protein
MALERTCVDSRYTRLRLAVSDLTLGKMLRGETTKLRAPPRLHRSYSKRAETVEALDLPDAWAVWVHPAASCEGAAR